MKHFVATRFNVRIGPWQISKDGNKVLTKEWLDNRFILFEKYCFPSILNQSNKNFYWIIFFDLDTPLFYKLKIKKLTEMHETIKIIFIDNIDSLNQKFKEIISSHLDEKEEKVITTRLDNDDSVHKNFIETIQSLSINSTDAVIDLRKGYQLHIANGFYECRNYYSQFNSFISVVENKENFNTVYSRKHKDWNISSKVICYEKSPLWIEVIHKSNKLNDVKYELMLTNNFDLYEFGIKPEFAKLSSIIVFFKNTKQIIKSAKKLYINIKCVS